MQQLITYIVNLNYNQCQEGGVDVSVIVGKIKVATYIEALEFLSNKLGSAYEAALTDNDNYGVDYAEWTLTSVDDIVSLN